MTEQTDAFAWWEDKQVAVRVNGRVVRGWVRAARRARPSGHGGTSNGAVSIGLASHGAVSNGPAANGLAPNGLAANGAALGDPSAGQMAIVLMIDSPAEAALFPSEITVGIYDDGRHGRPVGVARVWPEAGLDATVRTRPTAGLAVQRRLTHAAHRRTTALR